jgi:hypothetical protein
MTTTGRVVLCTILVVLAGCGAVPAGPWAQSGGETVTPPPDDETPTATPEPARDGLVGSGANATFTGGNFSGERLREAHRAYLDRAESATVVEWGTVTLRTEFDNDVLYGNGNTTNASLTVSRVNDSTGTQLEQSLIANETTSQFDEQTVFVGNGTQISVRGNESATAAAVRQFAGNLGPSAPGRYSNETGAVFQKEIDRDDGEKYRYEYNPTGSELANRSTSGNVTGMYLQTIRNTNLTYRGNDSVRGFSGHVYTAVNASALQSDALVFSNRSAVSEFSLTVVVAPEGYVRYVELGYAADLPSGSIRLDVQRALVGVNETSVPKPDWLDEARKNPQRDAFSFSVGNESDTSLGQRAANDTTVLDDGRVTLNVTMDEPTLSPRADIRPTERFHNPNLDEWRVGSVARYSYSSRDAEKVQITIHYDDSQVPGSESNITAAAWDRDDQFFYPLDATVDTEANTVTITLTGDEIEEYRRRAILAMDYERYLAFFEDDN